MPITFEGPAPIGAIVNLRRNTANVGGGLADQYAAAAAQQRSNAEQAQLMQQDRFHADNQLEQRQEFAASRDFSVRDAGMANAAMAQEQQRVGLQIQRNQAELTQAENMRLQRLKQGQDDVQKQLDTGAISRDEANVMWSQLGTGINPLEIRKAKSQIATQDMQQEGIKAHIGFETARAKAIADEDERKLQFATAQAEGKVKYIVNQASANTLRREWADDFKGRPPQELEAAIQDELMSRGDYKTHYISKDGTLVEAKLQDNAAGQEPGTHGGTSRSAGSGSGRHAAEQQFDASRAYHDAESAVDKQVTAGTIKPEDAEAEIAKRFAARKAAFSGYADEQNAAKAAGKPQPFSARDPSSGTPQQQTRVNKFEEARRSLPPNTPVEVQSAVSKAIDEGIRLSAKYTDDKGNFPPNTPGFVKKRMAEIDAVVNHAKAQQWPAPQQGGTNSDIARDPAKMAILEQMGRGRTGESVPPTQPGPPPGTVIPPGHVWQPPALVVQPGTGQKIVLPGRVIPAGATPGGDQRTQAEHGYENFKRGLRRLGRSFSGDEGPISFNY